MSHRTRPLVDRENKNPLATKANPTSNTNRLALGEVGNKIHLNERHNGNKVKDVKPPPLGAIKKQCSIPVRKITTNEAVVKKKPDKVLTKADALIGDKKTLVKITKPLLNFITEEPLAHSTKQLLEVINVDTSQDPFQVSEYVKDIYKYLLELEDQFRIEKGFLSGHKSTAQMRTVLVNWLIEVHINFKLLLETLHVTVAIVDRYLQVNKQIGRDTLQLVGTAALWIAGKYEDIYILDLSDLVYICDNTFTKKQILEMECDILKKLDFNLGRPLSIQFLRRFSMIAEVDADQHTLSKYLLELALINYDLCHLKPSLLAATACCLAISIISDLKDPSQAWTSLLVGYSSYTYKDIKPVILLMANALNKADAAKYKAIYTKYSSVKFYKISTNAKLKGPLMRKLLAES